MTGELNTQPGNGDGRNSSLRQIQNFVSPGLAFLTDAGATIHFLIQGNSLQTSMAKAAVLTANDITELGAIWAIEGSRILTDPAKYRFKGTMLAILGSALDGLDGIRARYGGWFVNLPGVTNIIKEQGLELPESFGSRWGGSFDVVHDRITELGICNVIAEAVNDDEFSDLMTAVGASCLASTLTKSTGLMQGIETPEEGDKSMRLGTMRFRRKALRQLCIKAREYQTRQTNLDDLTELANQIYNANIATGMQRILPVNDLDTEFHILDNEVARKEARKYTAVAVSISRLVGFDVIDWLRNHNLEGQTIFDCMPDLEQLHATYPETTEVSNYFLDFIDGLDQ